MFDVPGAKRKFPTRSPLKKRDFIIIEARTGHSNCVAVLEETCTGTPTPYCGDTDALRVLTSDPSAGIRAASGFPGPRRSSQA